MNNKPLPIDYYSDVLCIWAWIAQRRMDELITQFGDDIEIRHHYIDLFGDTNTRIHTQWSEKGLYDGFCDHVVNAASTFEEAPVNPSIWRKTRPTTSANAHLILKAVEISYGVEPVSKLALVLRKAFFVEAIDIGDLDILYDLIKQQGIELEPIYKSMNNGTAIAALMCDYQNSKELGIKGSPSFLIDNGRQTLYGNVGYRVLHANIKEIICDTSDQASWY